jgi:hypothetical protein
MSVTDSESSPMGFALSLEGDGLSFARQVDETVAFEVMRIAMGGTPSSIVGGGGSSTNTGSTGSAQKPRGRAKKGSTKATAGPKRRAGSVGLVGDLSLRPAGKKAFADFAAEKQPSAHAHKQAVIVYWLQKEAGVPGITVEHVNTCYDEAGWPRPNDLRNNLSLTASRKKWIDTSDQSDIKITTRGEDEVRHALPPTKAKK